MMIVNASFYSDSEIDLPQTGSPLMPTSAGHYALKTLTAFDTIRPYGRGIIRFYMSIKGVSIISKMVSSM